jgi:hypothetical protein
MNLKFGNVEDNDAVQNGTQSAIATKTHPNERENIMLFCRACVWIVNAVNNFEAVVQQ